MRRRQALKSRKLLSGPYLFWAVSFIIIPLLMILYYGLTDKSGNFTLMNLAQITTQENLKALGLALLLSFVSTLICLILAYPLAMILSEKNVNQTSFIVLIFILPMWMNFLLRTLAWQNLLEKNGVINMILHIFHIQDLTAQRQDGLCGTASCLFGGSAGGISLYNVDFTVFRIFIGAVSQLSGQGHALQSCFSSGQLPCFSGSLPGTLRQNGFLTDGLGHGRILLQEIGKLLAYHTVHRAPGLGISKLLLGLSLKLGILYLHTDNGSHTFPDVFSGKVRLIVL